MFGRNNQQINLSIEQSLEWLAQYSSQVGSHIINNTLLVDDANFIIGFKYNGVDTTNHALESGKNKLAVVKNDNTNHINSLYVIGIDKIGYKVPGLHQFNRDNQKYYYEVFMEYLETQDDEALIINLDNLGKGV